MKNRGFLSYRIADRRGVILIIAAIAIPNLLRSKIAANESSAVGSVRTSTLRVTYSSTWAPVSRQTWRHWAGLPLASGDCGGTLV